MKSRSATLAAAALMTHVLALPATGQIPLKPFDLTKLAEGVYGLSWREPLADPIEGNVLIVINDADVLLVDSAFLPSTAERIVAEVKKLTSKPVRYVVNTHWHNDHVQGNQVYRESWPQVEFISQNNTRRDAIERAFDQIPKDREQTAEAMQKYEGWLKDGKDDEGKVIDEKRRARILEILPFFKVLLAETERIRPTPPDVTFEDSLVIHRGSRIIEIRYLGLGNTRGDAVVFLPNERIVATGDLVVHPEPFGFYSYYKEWIATLEKVAALEADTFLPGHGPVLRDRKYIQTLQALLQALTEEVDAAVARGATLEETKKQVTLEAWKKQLAGENEGVSRAFEAFFVQPAVERAWRQAKGEPGAREQSD